MLIPEANGHKDGQNTAQKPKVLSKCFILHLFKRFYNSSLMDIFFKKDR